MDPSCDLRWEGGMLMSIHSVVHAIRTTGDLFRRPIRTRKLFCWRGIFGPVFEYKLSIFYINFSWPHNGFTRPSQLYTSALLFVVCTIDNHGGP